MVRKYSVHDLGHISRKTEEIDPLVKKIIEIEETYKRPDLPSTEKPMLERLQELRIQITGEKLSKKDYERYKEAAANNNLTNLLYIESRDDEKIHY